ncbi:MAG: UDP-2,3-diacylglucosamine diphosphatase LpxI [Rhodospirillaceae bacterium]|nr:UDP-2,3-diacylglucosamine diphosphatase LpxI [Rhodospirillaceae bacterium]MCY4238072.1 UDP-2,3-diacylglucosamine diphosphatase LpxI [Rhodospirillaceae bacterium]
MADDENRKLAIIAGGGDIPALAIEACEKADRPYFVFALEGHADDPAVFKAPHERIRLGSVSQFEKSAKREGVQDVVMIGRVRRPGMRELRPDAKGAAFMARAAMKAMGDDGLLRAVIGELERMGFRILAIQDLVTGLLAPEGVMTRRKPDAKAEIDIARGLEVARKLGDLDVGQAVVIQEKLVLGVEAIEGTDALLERCRNLHRKGSGGVLVKIKKVRQDRRVDMPTVGVATVDKAADAGLRGIVVQAGGTLVVNREAVLAAADNAKMFLVGIRLDDSQMRPDADG